MICPAGICTLNIAKARYACGAIKVCIFRMTTITMLILALPFYNCFRLILRLVTDDSNSVFRLSSKFGCTVEGGKQLLQLCKQLDMNVIGLR